VRVAGGVGWDAAGGCAVSCVEHGVGKKLRATRWLELRLSNCTADFRAVQEEAK